MLRINPDKLMLSKWTAANPRHREKHFLVIELLRDEREGVSGCVLEAVISHRRYAIEWRQLQDQERWLQGWK